MDHLPQDPFMLLSAVNMLLRDDEFDTLEDLCAYFDHDQTALQATLLEQGYTYNAALRQFRPSES